MVPPRLSPPDSLSVPSSSPPDPQEVYAQISRLLAWLDPGEQFERVHIYGKTKSGRVIIHTVPVLMRDDSGLTDFQRKALEVVAASPVPLKRAEVVRRATSGRGKATGRYGMELGELIDLDKLKVCHRVYVTDDMSKCPNHKT